MLKLEKTMGEYGMSKSSFLLALCSNVQTLNVKQLKLKKMKLSDSQKLMAVVNLIAGSMNDLGDLQFVNDDRINQAIKIVEDIADKIEPTDDIQTKEGIKKIIKDAFEKIEDDNAQSTLLTETIQRNTTIGKTKSTSIVQQAEKWGLLSVSKSEDKKTTIYHLNC